MSRNLKSDFLYLGLFLLILSIRISMNSSFTQKLIADEQSGLHFWIAFLASIGRMLWNMTMVLLGFALFFLPTIIAFRRNTEHMIFTFFLNLFLGATGIGWIFALIAACCDKVDRKLRTLEQTLTTMRDDAT